MAELELTVDVDAAPADAFAYLADLTHLAEWDSSVRSAELASDTGPAIGRTFEVVHGFYGKQLDATYTITDYVCDQTLGWSIAGRADGSTRIDLEATGSGTRLRYRSELRMRGMARLLDRGLKAALEGIGENIAAGLKKQLGG